MARATRYGVVAVGVLAIAGLASAVGRGGGDGGDERPEPAAVPAEVLSRTEELVDRTRPTAATGDQPSRPERRLVTITYYPADGGPLPLIVFAHGNTVSDPGHYQALLRSWAAAGYVVAAPIFPLSSTRLPGAAGDLVNQPADVSFVISEMLRLSDGPATPYAGRIDPGRVAAAGHSLGAMTTLGAVFHSCCRDTRVKAGIVLAGVERPFPNGEFFPAPVRTPILVVHGDADPLLPLAGARRIFDHAAPPKFLLTVLGGDHDVPYAGSNGQARPETLVVMTATRDFLDRYLKGEGDLDRMRRNLAGEPLARLETEDG